MLRFLRRVCFAACAAALTPALVNAQSTCGTGAPPEAWDQAFNKQVEEYLKNSQLGKTAMVTRVIPMVFHIVHFGETYGTYPNIDSNQIKSQVAVLNNDFAGLGLNAGNVPPEFAALKANTGIEFCLAAKDHTGSLMAEKGVHRINAAANSWPNPNTPTLDVVAYFNNTVIPTYIWDPNKYLNIWVSDIPAGYPVKSFAYYPPQSGLIGIFGGQIATGTNDGVWMYAKTCGTVGTIVAPTNKGRTLTHELGHYFGLRHIWGDGNCLSDYASDTPEQKTSNTGCPTHPKGVDECGVNKSPHGVMFMNFMDLTDDACKYMFTSAQSVRMWTALSQSPQRYLLGTHGICDMYPPPSTSSAVASFTVGASPCLNVPFMPFNTSSGYPPPSFLWSSSPNAQFTPNNTVPHPFISFSSPGTYVITLAATNSLSSSTYTQAVSVNFTCVPEGDCLDSLVKIRPADTLAVLRAPVNPQNSSCGTASLTGYLVGTNCQKDKEFAQYFGPSTYTGIPYPQVNSLIVLFDSIGTKGNSAITAKIYGGTQNGGPAGILGSPITSSYGQILATKKVTSVSYIGIPGQSPGRKIIPYRFDFNQPVVITAPSAGFFASIEGPTGVDSMSIFTDTRYNTFQDSSAWYMNFNGSWKTFKQGYNRKIHLAVIPQISCGPITGLEEAQQAFVQGITVMPNPAEGLFYMAMTFPQAMENVNIRVYNAVGGLLMQNQVSHNGSTVVQLDLQGQPAGIYFAEVSSGSQRAVKRLVISK